MKKDKKHELTNSEENTQTPERRVNGGQVKLIRGIRTGGKSTMTGSTK